MIVECKRSMGSLGEEQQLQHGQQRCLRIVAAVLSQYWAPITESTCKLLKRTQPSSTEVSNNSMHLPMHTDDTIIQDGQACVLVPGPVGSAM